MTIHVRLFASIRETVGMASLAVDAHPATVAALRDELVARGPVWSDALGRHRPVRASVNQVMVDEGAPLSPGDEVAFFPPVTGG